MVIPNLYWKVAHFIITQGHINTLTRVFCCSTAFSAAKSVTWDVMHHSHIPAVVVCADHIDSIKKYLH